MGNDDNIISVAGVDKVFGRHDGGVRAVEGLNFCVSEGEFVSIIGPSGCGKTTTLDMIAGFERPTLGSITFLGNPVTGPSPDRVVVFQDHVL